MDDTEKTAIPISDQEVLKGRLQKLDSDLSSADNALKKFQRRNRRGGHGIAIEEFFNLEHHDRSPGLSATGHHVSYSTKNVLSFSSFLNKANPVDGALLTRISDSRRQIRKCRQAISNTKWKSMSKESWRIFQYQMKQLRVVLTLGEPDILLDDLLHFRFDGHGTEREKKWFEKEVGKIEALTQTIREAEQGGHQDWEVPKFFHSSSSSEMILYIEFLKQTILLGPFNPEELRTPAIQTPSDAQDTNRMSFRDVAEVSDVKVKAVNQFSERAKELCNARMLHPSQEKRLVALAKFFQKNKDDLFYSPFRSFREVVTPPDLDTNAANEKLTEAQAFLTRYFNLSVPQDAPPQASTSGDAICEVQPVYGDAPVTIGSEFAGPSRAPHSAMVNLSIVPSQLS